MTKQKYQPSCGTEGMDFIESQCGDCIHDRGNRESDGFGGCILILNSMLYEVDHPDYPKEWVHGPNGPSCSKYLVDCGQEIKVRCDKTTDMFNL